jgi:TPR repeat protein
MAGNARAAFALGTTFDEAYLTRWGVVGFDADMTQARDWYDRALKLGSFEASRELERATTSR